MFHLLPATNLSHSITLYLYLYLYVALTFLCLYLTVIYSSTTSLSSPSPLHPLSSILSLSCLSSIRSLSCLPSIRSLSCLPSIRSLSCLPSSIFPSYASPPYSHIPCPTHVFNSCCVCCAHGIATSSTHLWIEESSLGYCRCYHCSYSPPSPLSSLYIPALSVHFPFLYSPLFSPFLPFFSSPFSPFTFLSFPSFPLFSPHLSCLIAFLSFPLLSFPLLPLFSPLNFFPSVRSRVLRATESWPE
jgi:hypothetical protein